MNARWLGRSRGYLLRINVSDSDNENSHAFRPDKNKDRFRDNFCYKVRVIENKMYFDSQYF